MKYVYIFLIPRLYMQFSKIINRLNFFGNAPYVFISPDFF